MTKKMSILHAKSVPTEYSPEKIGFLSPIKNVQFTGLPESPRELDAWSNTTVHGADSESDEI